MNEFLKTRWSLQWFAGEGAASAGDGGSGQAGLAGNEPAAPKTNPEQDEMQRLGIPKEQAKRFRESRKRRQSAEDVEHEPPKEQTQTETQTPAAKAESPRRTLRDLVREDQELNQELQSIVNERLERYARSGDRSKEQLQALSPALDVLARKYGLQAENGDELDLGALGKAIVEDDELYEQRAMELGTDVATARRMDELERIAAKAKEKESQDLEQRQFREHIQKLIRQSEEVKALYPGFDLIRELEQNEKFRLWTSPQFGMSVKDAFYALHREELQRMEAEALAKEIEQKMSAKIAAGVDRPDEQGRAQSASIGQTRAQELTPEQRQVLYRRIHAGEIIFPGQEF